MNLGPWELGIILIILLLVFGGTKLPKLARSLGQAQKEFKEGIADGTKETDTSGGGSQASGGDNSGGGPSGKNGSA